MSIFKKLKDVFEKKEEAPSPRYMSLNELEAWVEEEIKKEEGRGADKCNPIIQEIEEVRDDALKIIKDVEGRKFSKEIENRMYKPVKTAKPIYVKGMRGALRHIKTRDLQDYDSLLSFQKSLVNSLKSIDSFQRGPGRNVTFVYREEMAGIGTELNSLIDLSNKLTGIIEELKDNIDALDNISSNLKEIRTYKEKKLEIKTKRKELRKKRNELKREKSALRKKLNILEKSDAFQQFLSTQEEVESLEEERIKLMGQIYNQLHPLKRVFKKFRRIAENGNYELSRKDLACLGEYIDDPRQTFLSEDKRDLVLLRILKGARESIENEELQLKVKEKNKIIEKIRLLEKNCVDMREKYEGINEKEKSLIDKLSSFKAVSRRDELQKKIKGVEDYLEELKREGIDLDKDTSEREKGIETLLKDVETLASDVMGQGIKIHESALSSEEY